MNNYRMRNLQKLDQAEMQVKQGVRTRLRSPQKDLRKRYLPTVVGICATLIAVMLVFLSIKPLDQMQTVQSSENFSLSDEVTLGTLDIRESYFIAASLGWDGDEKANLEKIELVDGEGKIIAYDKDHIAMSAFNTNEMIEPGLYNKNQIENYDLWSVLDFQPHSEKIVLFNVIANDGFAKRDDLHLKLTFDLGGQENMQVYNWSTLNNLEVVEHDSTKLIEQLNLSEQELTVYETFKQTNDKSILKGLSPLNIARLYMLAEIEGNTKLRYAFYTTQPEWIMWSYEEEQNFSPFDIISLNNAVQLFKDLSLGSFEFHSENEGYISFKHEGVEAFFYLIQNQEGIWEVAFTPMQ